MIMVGGKTKLYQVTPKPGVDLNKNQTYHCLCAKRVGVRNPSCIFRGGLGQNE